MDNKAKLKAKLTRLLKKAKNGQKIEMFADGKPYGTYEVGHQEPDMKTPQEWLATNLCFGHYKGFNEFNIILV